MANVFVVSGLQITAGQWTMSGQKYVLSGQILRWPDNFVQMFSLVWKKFRVSSLKF